MSDKLDKQTRENLEQLQLLQQRLTAFASQKQQFQIQLAEIENALDELKKAKSPTYVLIGGILIEKPKATIKKDLESKKKELDIKIKSFETHEKKTTDKAKELQEELAKILK